MLKVKIPLFITVFAGLFMILKFVLNWDPVKTVADELEQWCLIVFATSLILGVANILRINLKVVLSRGKDWGYKLVLILSMFLMISVGLYDLFIWEGKTISSGSHFVWMFDSFIVPLGSTMFALLAFFIASAAFRAFRARNVRAALLLGSGAMVMLGRVPIGRMVHENIPNIADWIMSYPNTAGQRALIIGAAMGVIATGLRIIFGVERPYLSGD